jgi:hypothetical protein
MPGEQALHGAPLDTRALAMNESHLQDASLAARLDVRLDHPCDLTWSEGVQIERSVDGYPGRRIHLFESIPAGTPSLTASPPGSPRSGG